MNPTAETKILRAQVLLMEAERILSGDSRIDHETRQTLTDIAEKAAALAGVAVQIAPEVTAPAPAVDEVMDYDTASEYLRISRSTLRGYIYRRMIPFSRIGGGSRGSVRFQKSELDQWMRSIKTEGRV